MKYFLSLNMLLGTMFSSCYADQPINLPASAKSYDYYGNSVTEEFEQAITGSTPMDEAEQKYMNSLVPVKVNNRFYGKFAANLSTQKVSGFKIDDSSSTAIKALTLVDKKASQSSANFEFGLGYHTGSFRIEGEYLYNKKLEYKPEKYDTGSQINSFIGSVQANSFLLSGYYDFTEIFYVRPFVGASAGIAYNTVTSKYYAPGGLNLSGEESKKSKLGLSFAAAGGLRARVMQRLVLQLGVRLLNNGKVQFSNEKTTDTTIIKVNGKYWQLNYGLGVSYIF